MYVICTCIHEGQTPETAVQGLYIPFGNTHLIFHVCCYMYIHVYIWAPSDHFDGNFFCIPSTL